MVALIATAFGLYKASVVFREGTPKGVAANQAIWIARYWDPKLTIEEICNAASKNLNTPIDPQNWKPAMDGGLVEGPIVEGKQIYIEEDLSVVWKKSR